MSIQNKEEEDRDRDKALITVNFEKQAKLQGCNSNQKKTARAIINNFCQEDDDDDPEKSLTKVVDRLDRKEAIGMTAAVDLRKGDKLNKSKLNSQTERNLDDEISFIIFEKSQKQK